MGHFAQPTHWSSMSNNNKNKEELNACSYQFQAATIVPDSLFFVKPSILEGKHTVVVDPAERTVGSISKIGKVPLSLSERTQGTHTKILATGWDLKRIQVQRLPMYVEIGKDSVEFPKSKIDIVLLALQDLFLALSLQVQYYSCPNEKDTHTNTTTKTTTTTNNLIHSFRNEENEHFYTVMARCSSMEDVRFIVMIWETNKNQYAVEVSHNSGCKDAYYNRKYAVQVLEAVKEASQQQGGEEYHYSATTITSKQYYDPLANFRDPTLGNQIDNLLRHANVQVESEDAIKIVEDLVQTKRFDTVKLGLDSMLVQTNPRCSGQKQALGAARAVLLQSRPIADIVTSLALEDRFPAGYFDKDILIPTVTNQHALTAMTVLAQAVSLLADDTSDLQDFVDRRSFVVEQLMKRVQDADQAPHFAYLAAHILAVIIRAVPETRHEIRCHTVEHAKIIGSSCHGALAKASDRLLQELGVLSCCD
jgi:hypothetical protein